MRTRRSGGRVAAERRRRGGRLPRRHAPRCRVARREPGAGAAREALPARGLRLDAAALRRRPAGSRRAGRRPGGVARGGRGGRRRAGRRRRRPVRAGRARLHERHHRSPEGRRAQPAQPARAGRGAHRDPRLRRDAAQGRLLPVHRPQHGGAHHAARVAGGRLLDRDGPHRRRGRGRVDPHRARSPRGTARPPCCTAWPRWTTIAADDLASLTEVWTGGADCPEAIRSAFEAKFGLPVLATYGLSEAPTVVSIDDRDGSHVAGASGRPLPAPVGAHRRRRRRDRCRRGRPARSACRPPTTATA